MLLRSPPGKSLRYTRTFARVSWSLQQSHQSCLRRPFTRAFSRTSVTKEKSLSTSSPQARTVTRKVPEESAKLEAIKLPTSAKPEDASKVAAAFLAEQNVTNQEQRRADWAIMKEMAKYLWPKVWENAAGIAWVADPQHRMTSERELGLGLLLPYSSALRYNDLPYIFIVYSTHSCLDFECSSAFLFQKYCGFHECRFRCPWWHCMDCGRIYDRSVYVLVRQSDIYANSAE